MQNIHDNVALFTNNDKESAVELCEVINAYKYFLIYGAVVDTVSWNKKQTDLYRTLMSDENNSSTG